MDLPSRAAKALKIERILNLEARAQSSESIKLLDIGTGSGGIASYFANHPTLACAVDSVDTTDNRMMEGYAFHRVENTSLPFPDASFDVVISNHVIEHVGESREQIHHLHEMKRVLRPDGVIYLAVPNRWMLQEPHYQLRFLSWLPPAWRSSYLRFRKKGNFYDCVPLSLSTATHYLAASGFSIRNVSIEAMRLFFSIEKPNTHLGKFIKKCPEILLRPLQPIIPTLVFTLKKR
jgi:SAM-dependent methyltransferase